MVDDGFSRRDDISMSGASVRTYLRRYPMADGQTTCLLTSASCGHFFGTHPPQEDQESWEIFPGIAKLKLDNTSKFPSSLASSFFVKKFKEVHSNRPWHRTINTRCDTGEENLRFQVFLRNSRVHA